MRRGRAALVSPPPTHLDEPRVGQSYPNYYVAQLASKFNKVVLSGAGGDEIFGGYDWFRTYLQIEERFWRHAEKFPVSARLAASVLAKPLVKKVLKKRMANELVRRLGANESLFWGGAVCWNQIRPRKHGSTNDRSMII